MICTKSRCIFVHVPKTGGQSIEHFFLNLHGLSWEERAPLLLRYNDNPDLGPERLAHLKAQEYTDLGYISKHDFQSFYSFAFVRNPWARLVSEYKYRGHDRRYSFKGFVTSGLPTKSDYTDAYRHIIPQSDYICNDDGVLLVDFVGKFEDLQSDFDIVCERLGLGDSKLPHINKSARPKNFKSFILKSVVKKLTSKDPYPPKTHYSFYYDDELRDMVGDFYRRDIELFGYRFQSQRSLQAPLRHMCSPSASPMSGMH